MAIIKPSSGKSSAKILSYLEKGKPGEPGYKDPEKRFLAYSSDGYDNIKDIETEWRINRDAFGRQPRNEKERRSARAYAHFSISPDPKGFQGKTDAEINETLKEIGHDFAEKYLDGHQHAFFIHRDTDSPHIHVIANSINLKTEKKYQISLYEQNKLKQEFSDHIAKKYGFNTLKLRDSHDRIPSPVQHILQKNPNEYSWTEDLKSRIGLAVRGSSMPSDFKKELSKLGVEHEKKSFKAKNGKTISYDAYRLSPDKQGLERGWISPKKLGTDFRLEHIEREIESVMDARKSGDK